MTRPAPPAVDDALVPEVERFAEHHRLARRAAEIDRDGAFPADIFRAMGEAGLLGLHVAPSLGGRGLTLRRVGVALFHLARRGGTAFAKLSLQPEFASVLADHGSPELVERHYRPLVRGQHLVGNHVTEPGAGSDAGALTARASREGDRWVIHGTKTEAAFATEADAAIVYARVDRGPGADSGVSAFLVPQDLPGVRRSVIPDLGERWMRRGRVEYEDVPVPGDHLLGEVGRGFEYVKEEFTRERALLGAIYLGVGWASWEETVAHVGDRVAFGRPLSSQEGVSFPLVEDWASLEAAWLYVDRTLARLDGGESPRSEAGLAKWMATESALRAIDHAIQFHGGRGYSSELPHERRWRDVRSGGIAHGPSEVLHLQAARQLWAPMREVESPIDPTRRSHSA